MKRLLIAGMLGLALAGCSQGRANQRRVEYPPPPASVDNVPTLGDTINGGLPSADKEEAEGPAKVSVSVPVAPPDSRAAAPRPPAAPVGVDPVPVLSDTINSGMPLADPQTRQASRGPDAATASSTPANPPGPPPDLPPLPPETASAAPATPEVAREPAKPLAASPQPDPVPASLVPADLPADLPPVAVDSPAPVPAELTNPGPASAPATNTTAPPDGLPPVDAPHDETVQQTQATRPVEAQSRVDSGTVIGLTVASVGDEQISLSELQDAVREHIRTYVPKGQSQNIPREQMNMLASNVLEQLVNQALYVQEAKRILLKKEAQRKMFYEFVDKQWKEREIPKLIQRHNVKSEIELRQILEEEGRSLELMRERYRKEMLGTEFLRHQLQERIVRPELREMWTYYQEHIASFDRPARVTWRELEVKIGPGVDRTQARQKTEELLNRLRRGEDFATLAKTASQGATAQKGGYWQTQPEASSAPAVNEALNTLPLDQISPALESPDGFHVVRVEDRREAGPAPFAEVQDKIRGALQELAFDREAEAFTKKLRERTVITYYIQGKAVSQRDAQTKRASASP